MLSLRITGAHCRSYTPGLMRPTVSCCCFAPGHQL
uniref:Uncharacterized protein n=1 Tax=Anguilla anguilla TaxID=7936 RepID=A0A0E9TFA7_ANGAN